LYKNFGINVEADLLAWDEREEPGNKWHMDAFFGATGEDGRPETYGLHTNRVAKSIRNGWVKKMLDHNQGVKFSFHALKEIQFPDEWVDKASRVKNEAIGAFADSMRRIIDRQNTQANYGPPIGVTGGSELAQPVLGAKFILTSNFGPRVPPVDGASKDHNGIDFGCGRGVPVLSPEFGVVETTSHHPANGNGGGNYVVI
jgi:murein DD-endopeptidase MepM/ murein hydrolase activator NlpD